jgi:hypothetical protein
MHGTRAIWFALLAALALGAGCSGKKSEPAPKAEAPHTPVAQTAPADADVPADAAPVDAAAPPVDPIASRFRRHYTTDDALTERMQRRIRYHLRDQTKAPIALSQIIRVPQTNGGVDVFGIYEYSVYEDCVLGYPNRKEGRENCQGEAVSLTEQDPIGRVHTDDTKVRLNEQCVRLAVVRARFAPPGPGIPADAGGAVTISSAKLEGTLCEARDYQHLFVADLDGDEKLELFIDITTSEEKVTTSPGMRDVPEQRTIGHRFERHLYVFSGDDANGFALSAPLGDWEDSDPEPQELVELRDVNKDRRLDIVAKEHCFSVSTSGGEELCLGRTRYKTTYIYDPQRDVWSRPEDMKEPATGDKKESATDDKKESATDDKKEPATGAAKEPAKPPAAGAAKEPVKAPAAGASAPP